MTNKTNVKQRGRCYCIYRSADVLGAGPSLCSLLSHFPSWSCWAVPWCTWSVSHTTPVTVSPIAAFVLFLFSLFAVGPVVLSIVLGRRCFTGLFEVGSFIVITFVCWIMSCCVIKLLGAFLNVSCMFWHLSIGALICQRSFGSVTGCYCKVLPVLMALSSVSRAC